MKVFAEFEVLQHYGLKFFAVSVFLVKYLLAQMQIPGTINLERKLVEVGLFEQIPKV